MTSWKNVFVIVCVVMISALATSYGQASTLADKLVGMSNQPSASGGGKVADEIEIQVELLEDSTGLRYIGGVVKNSHLASYLHQLSTILGDDFTLFRDAQKLRDHSKFHITLVNPFEFKALSKAQQQQLLSQEQTAIAFKLVGLGNVASNDARAYFVVAESKQAQALRERFQLSEKDFHVTLGFSPNDVHGVRKNRSTLIAVP